MVTTLVLWVLVCGVAAFLYFAHHVEPRRLQVTRLALAVPRLAPELEGLRIVHLSDLHVQEGDGGFGAEMARRAVALSLQCQPDLICLTGDLAQASRAVHTSAAILRPLTQYPMYVVMGNHDHDKMLETELGSRRGKRLTAAEWREVMTDIGATVLQNEHTVLNVRGQSVVIAGSGDPSCGWDDLPRTLAGDPRGELHLLLAHSPDVIDDPLTEWADLVLCGHTHGGQFQLPGLGTPWAPVWHDRRRAAGLMQFGSTLLFVSRGVAAGIRWRFLCPPEVVEFTLTRGPGATPRSMERSHASHQALR